MSTATKTAQVLLGVAFLGAGGQKLAGAEGLKEDFVRYGYPQWFRLVTGAVEVTGALGMLLGLRCAALVPAAGLLLSSTMVGALATHVRIGDPAKKMVPSAVLLALSAAVLVGI